MKRVSLFQRGLSLLLVLSVLLALGACDRNTTAATMRLKRTQGTVDVSNGDGKSIPPLDNLGLFSGYGVGTGSVSYAWINLDDVKLVKLDQDSEIAIQKEGKALDIELKSGGLYFNVTEPLADDETMNIRVSSMLVGIRGTCGWVEYQDGLPQVYLVEGKVECTANGQTVQVSAGEIGRLTADGELVVEPYSEQDIPVFVEVEIGSEPPSNTAEVPGPDASEPPENVGGTDGNVTWSYSGGTLTIGGSGPMPDYDNAVRPWDTYSGQIRTVTISNGVTRIGNCAFQYCSNLARVTIPNSVNAIGNHAFYSCGSLTDVTIPPSVTSIGDSAFWRCSSLTSVTIPNGVVSIGSSTFGHCSSLTSVTIPNGVASIGPSAFSSCSSLTSVTIPASVNRIGEMAFYSCNKLAEVHFGGSESQWERISIGYANDALYSASRYYAGTRN